MLNIVANWFKRNFSDPDLVMLLFSLMLLFLLLFFFGKMLAPILASIILAYLLDGVVERLVTLKMPRVLAVSLVCLLAVGVFVLAILYLIPLLWQQLSDLINVLPSVISKGEKFLLTLPHRYPSFITSQQMQHWFTTIQSNLTGIGKELLSKSLMFIPSLIELVVYFVLVPLMVFFFLKDSVRILNWFEQFMPKNRRLMASVWSEVNEQMSTYVRSKFIEVVLVAVTTTLVFWMMGLDYSLLLGALVGVSTIIPFVGAIVATVPVVIVAFMQWGFDAHTLYLLIVYAVIGILDGNVLVPLLFSETMKLHPLAVIVAVIAFGGLWGFWGVFFAIPLLTLVIAVLNAWSEPELEV